MKKTSITVVVLTYNEKANIGRTLGQLSWFDKVLVVDSFSTDNTVEIACAFPNVEVIQRTFDTHTTQWNFGLDQVKSEWALTLDADYELSPELQAEIVRLESPPEVVGCSADFEYRIFGHPLRASSYPLRVVLFRVAKGRYVDDGHTQLLKPNGRVEKLTGKIYHDDRKPLSHWIAAQDRYAALEARHLLSMPRSQPSRQDRLRLRVYFAPIVMALYLLIVRRLVTGGWPAWYYVFQRVIAEMLLSLRLIEGRHGLVDEGKSEV